MAQDFTLYYFPTSHYSLKAYMTLQEKGVPFKEHIVDMNTNEQQEDWYLKLNPKGEVPVLQHGTTFTPDSEAIIDYVDQHYPEGPRLAPDVSTPLGQEVRDMRQMLHAIPIDKITYGVFANRKFCATQPRFPKPLLIVMGKSGAVKRLQKMIDGFKVLQKDATPERQTELAQKIKVSEERIAAVRDEDVIANTLDELELIFDTMESRLERSTKDNLGEAWLMGEAFTAADITAAVLSFRLYMLGMDERYYSDTKRKVVKDYYRRVWARPSMKKTMETSDRFLSGMARGMVFKVVKVGVFVGVAAVGVYAAYRLYNSK